MLTTLPLRCLLFINTPRNGWSETWGLPFASMPVARPIVEQLAYARSLVLAQDCVVEWACVHQAAAPWPEQAAITDALQPAPQWGPVDNDAVGLLWRFETALGLWSNHLWRAVDDSEIVGDLWVRQPFVLDFTPAGPAPNIFTATITQLWTYALKFFRDNTCHHQAVGVDGDGNVIWNLEPWANLYFRHVSSRDTGRRWKRVSWEAGQASEGPEFSPCGSAVSVSRFCYMAKAKFGPGRPTQQLHWYFANPHASVLPIPTIFWPRRRDQLVRNRTGVGEVTQLPASCWNEGIEYGVAPADHYSGTADNFLGLTPQPWPVTQSTPADLQPACDAPLRQRIMGPGGIELGGAGAHWMRRPGPGGLAIGGHGATRLRNSGPGGVSTGGRGASWGKVTGPGGVSLGGTGASWGHFTGPGGLSLGGKGANTCVGYYFDMAGVANGTAPACNVCDGEWVFIGNGPNVPGPSPGFPSPTGNPSANAFWNFTGGSGIIRLYLHDNGTGLDVVYYDTSTWLGPDHPTVMTLTFASGECVSWPASVTLYPIFGS